jgi:hypothetical protein
MRNSHFPIRVAIGDVYQIVEQSRDAIKQSLLLLQSVPDYEGPMIGAPEDSASTNEPTASTTRASSRASSP